MLFLAGSPCGRLRTYNPPPIFVQTISPTQSAASWFDRSYLLASYHADLDRATLQSALCDLESPSAVFISPPPAHLLMATPSRCPWPILDDPLYVAYHDTEWGVPVHDDRKLFEFLVLEAFQAGLSWRTVLHKRENFRAAFAKFDYRRVDQFGPRELKRLTN